MRWPHASTTCLTSRTRFGNFGNPCSRALVDDLDQGEQADNAVFDNRRVNVGQALEPLRVKLAPTCFAIPAHAHLDFLGKSRPKLTTHVASR